MSRPAPKSRIKSVLLWRRRLPMEAAELWMSVWGNKFANRSLISEQPGKKQVGLDVYPSHLREAQWLKKHFGGSIRKLPPSDWWKPERDDDRPLFFGRKICVVLNARQARYQRKQNPDGHIIIVPAGMAFGTGQHATTGMCLQMLERIPVKGHCLDVGCGSGILSLAAKLLGWDRVEGIDFDPIAVRVSKENARRNGVHVSFRRGLVEKLDGKKSFDLVIANLFSELLIRNAQKILKILKVGGNLVLSGIRKDQRDEVRQAFRKLKLVRESSKEKWVCLFLQKETAVREGEATE